MSDRTAPPSVHVISPTFHPEQVGTPHYVTDLVRCLEDGGTHVRVVTNQPYYPAFRRFPGYGRARRRDTFGQVTVYRLPTIVPRGGSSLGRLVSDTNMLLQVVVALLLGRIHRSPAVIAVSPGSPMSLLGGLLLRARGGRLTAVVHDIGFGLADTTGGRLGRLLARPIRAVEVWALNRANHVTVLSDHMGDALRAAGVTTPIRTVELWPTIEVAEGYIDPPPSVLYSGNLGRKQGVHRLLDLADDLRDAAPDVAVVIRGDGSERAVLRRQARDRGLGNLVFEDLVPADALAESLAAARVHVVPQLPEGAAFAVPSKVVNILAAGRPVVVTARADSPVGRLATRCRAVILADPDDPDALSREVEAVLAMPPDRYRSLCGQARSWARGISREEAVRATVGDGVATPTSRPRPS